MDGEQRGYVQGKQVPGQGGPGGFPRVATCGVAGGRCRRWRWTWRWPWMWACSGGGGHPGCWPRRVRARARRRRVPTCPSARRGHRGGPGVGAACGMPGAAHLGLGACGAFGAAGAGFARPSAVPGGRQTSVDLASGQCAACNGHGRAATLPIKALVATEVPAEASREMRSRRTRSTSAQRAARFQAGRLAVLLEAASRHRCG